MVASQAKRIAVLLGAFGRRGPSDPCSSDASLAVEGPLLAPEPHAGTSAAAAARDKADWLASQGSVTIGHVAPYYRSEGFLICLEGLSDASGSPVLYSHGMPHGSEGAVLQAGEVDASGVTLYDLLANASMERDELLSAHHTATPLP